jgi:hypothetical protein
VSIFWTNKIFTSATYYVILIHNLEAPDMRTVRGPRYAYCPWYMLIGTFTKLRNVTIGFVMSVHPHGIQNIPELPVSVHYALECA